MSIIVKEIKCGWINFEIIDELKKYSYSLSVVPGSLQDIFSWFIDITKGDYYDLEISNDYEDEVYRFIKKDDKAILSISGKYSDKQYVSIQDTSINNIIYNFYNSIKEYVKSGRYDKLEWEPTTILQCYMQRWKLTKDEIIEKIQNMNIYDFNIDFSLLKGYLVYESLFPYDKKHRNSELVKNIVNLERITDWLENIYGFEEGLPLENLYIKEIEALNTLNQ